jgi:two-component system KDP operon response regulator KdpE
MEMPDNATHTLLIEDDPAIRQFMRASIIAHGFRLTEAVTGTAGVFYAIMLTPDVVILDLGLPDTDGIEVIRRIRQSSPTPILVISARPPARDKLAALNAGANDYLPKPFSTDELLRRIDVVVRYTARRLLDATEQLFTMDQLRVDLARRTVSVGGRDVELSPLEYDILSCLIKRAGSIVTLDQLRWEMSGEGRSLEDWRLRTGVAQLRRKIEEDVVRPHYLLSEPDAGYRLAVT